MSWLGRVGRSNLVLAGLLGAALFLAGRRAFVLSDAAPMPARGTVAPDFRAPTLDGANFQLSAHHGEVLLLDFWATWCPPCVASLPVLDQVHAEFAADGFRVVGVNQEPDAVARVRRFLDQRGVRFPSVVDTGTVAARYGVHTFPTSFLLDRAGRVQAVYRGPVGRERLRGDVLRLLSP